MFRRDKASLSGRLHRFAKGVLTHRPQDRGPGGIMACVIAGASRAINPPQDAAPGKYPSRRFPAPSTRIRRHQDNAPRLRQPSTTVQPITRTCHTFAWCRSLHLTKPRSQPKAQARDMVRTRKRTSIFHIKKYFLFVPNLFPKCSHFVPKTICSSQHPIYKGFKAFLFSKNAVFPCSQEK